METYIYFSAYDSTSEPINKIKASSNHPTDINKILCDLDDHTKLKASLNFK